MLEGGIAVPVQVRRGSECAIGISGSSARERTGSRRRRLVLLLADPVLVFVVALHRSTALPRAAADSSSDLAIKRICSNPATISTSATFGLGQSSTSFPPP